MFKKLVDEFSANQLIELSTYSGSSNAHNPTLLLFLQGLWLL